MILRTTILLSLLLVCLFPATGQNAWINEFHYDNSGPDQNEFVEVVIQNPGLYTLSNFTVSLYRGSNGRFNDEITLDQFTAGDLVANYQIYYYDISIQDNYGGISLDYNGVVLDDFIAYEASFSANNGNANGLTATLIGVTEDGSSSPTESLQLTGTGSQYSDFSWASPATATKGSENTAQTLDTNISTDTDFTAFSLPQETLGATIDAVNHTIDINIIITADITNQVASFTLSDGATAFISGVSQMSGSTANDFTNTVTYTIIAEDGTTSQDWDVSVSVSPEPNAWINEFHYDQSGQDNDEFIEVVLQNKDLYMLDDFVVTLYDGATGSTYSSPSLNTFTEGTTQDGLTYYYLDFVNTLQNGADGFSLSYKGILIMFISYEGTFIAVDGPASGFTSEDVGFSQAGSTNASSSIHLTGPG